MGIDVFFLLRKKMSGKRFARNGVGRFVVATLCALMIVDVAAQNLGNTVRQIDNTQRREQERAQRELEQLRQKNQKPSGMDTEELLRKPSDKAADATCRDIDVIEIDGAPNLTDAEREIISKEFSGRCLNVGEIERLLGEITRLYLQKGYITTRAYLPAQDLSQKKLKILVVEGMTGKIIIDDGNKNSVSIINAFPGVEGELLNLRDLEQGLDQINRLASNNATMNIAPGQQPGVSDVIISNQPGNPFHAYFSTDNQGTESTGRDQVSVSLTGDNLLGFNDMLGVSHRESAYGDREGENSTSDSFNASLPFGYLTLSYGVNYSTYESTVDLPSGLQSQADGINRNHNVLADYVVFRDQLSRLSFSAGITNKESKNYFANQLLTVASRKLTVLDVDANYSIYALGGVIRANLGYARGLKIIDALEDPDELPSDIPRAQFHKYKYALGYSLPMSWGDLPASFSSDIVGQHALDTLYGSEQILIGSIYSVRGFVDNSLSGDDGYYWRNELAIEPSFQLGNAPINSRLYTGIDYGNVKARANDAPEGEMSGFTLGAQFRWQDLTFDIFNTRPISVPNEFEREGSQTWLGLSYAL